MSKQVLIIAEAGVNHNGDIDLAKRLIDAAAAAKVDYVKFQTWVTEDVINYDAPKADYQIKNDGEITSQYEMLKKLELSFDDFIELKKYSENQGVCFLSTPDEKASLDFLADRLNLELIKIGSGEVTNLPFLRQVGAKKKDVVLSTGMSNLGEIETALITLQSAGAKSVSLLHCTSNYPASFQSVNLKAIHTLSSAFGVPVGYSDHTEGLEVSVAAVALGAVIIEKHFTLDKNMQGPDHKASLNPKELTELVKQIRNVESAVSGSGLKIIQPEELANRDIMRKGVYTKHDIQQGQILTEEMFLYKRPVKDFPASHVDFLVGKKTSRHISKGEAICFSDIIYAS